MPPYWYSKNTNRNCLYYLIVGQDSAVGIATCYGLEGLEIKSWWGWGFLHPSRPVLRPTQPSIQWVELVWNLVTHGDAREGKWKGKLANGVGSQYSHATSEHGVSSITQADAHTSVASSWLNWRPHQFKWTCPFRRKTKSGFCACAITFRTSYTGSFLGVKQPGRGVDHLAPRLKKE
jgi:hypothetical protein